MLCKKERLYNINLKIKSVSGSNIIFPKYSRLMGGISSGEGIFWEEIIDSIKTLVSSSFAAGTMVWLTRSPSESPPLPTKRDSSLPPRTPRYKDYARLQFYW